MKLVKLKKDTKRWLSSNHSYKEVEEKMGISKSTLIRAKRQLKKENTTEITVTS
ncbi:hypothetical protein [Bacillus cereus]|uniref:hypothetical protein n=1 Tax=Bacillus cereus TaxID=1396 RepID=UPI0018F4A1B6|nr:hypothetical protein [Bacillus cereus]MBJ8024991.1 hypothetical protein [Bacillus cereus]MBJ8037467.1 hypothetical protein [Bacillus cereus]